MGFDTIKARLIDADIHSNCTINFAVHLNKVLPEAHLKYDEHGEANYAYIEIDGLAIKAYKDKLDVENSIANFYLGVNQKTLSRATYKEAIDKLERILQLPIGKARVRRFDFAENIITSRKVITYFTYLGELKGAHKDNKHRNSLYYNANNKKFSILFYDKHAEQNFRGKSIVSLFQNQKILRYEIRFFALSKLFKRTIKLEDLSDENLYIEVVNRWENAYKKINKLNTPIFNLDAKIHVKDWDKLAWLALIEKYKGEEEIKKQLEQSKQELGLKGRQTDNNKGKILRRIKLASKSKVVTKESKLILELNKKIAEAAEYHRFAF